MERAVATGWGYNVGMEHSFVDGRLYLVRTPEEREPLLVRLRKIG
jgi:hypothetical protein